jgi:hypothetical protein
MRISIQGCLSKPTQRNCYSPPPPPNCSPGQVLKDPCRWNSELTTISNSQQGAIEIATMPIMIRYGDGALSADIGLAAEYRRCKQSVRGDLRILMELWYQFSRALRWRSRSERSLQRHSTRFCNLRIASHLSRRKRRLVRSAHSDYPGAHVSYCAWAWAWTGVLPAMRAEDCSTTTNHAADTPSSLTHLAVDE